MSTIRRNDYVSPLNVTFTNIQLWANSNLMLIKNEKSKQIFFSRNCNFDNSSFVISDIPVQNQMRILGIIFDDSLKWNSHIHEICKKASSKMYVLHQLKQFVTKEKLIVIFQSCIRSILEYCSPLFTDLNVGLCKELEKIQNRGHFIICESWHCDCSNFVPLSYRRLIIAYKLFLTIMKNENHVLHHFLFTKMKHSGQFRLPSLRSTSFEQSFFVTMSKLNNSGFRI